MTATAQPSSNTRASNRAATGVLLVNLGTPEAPTTPAVRRFLAEFLWDKRVIDYPRPLWWLVLNGIILRIRPSKSAHAYASIWTPQGSPLMIESLALCEAVQKKLGDAYKVALGMTYGAPGIADELRKFRTQGISKIVVLPLYPQYSGTTSGSVFDRVMDELKTWPALPELRFVNHYFSEPAYLDALAASIRAHWQTNPRKHLLFSFHGIPQRYVNNGDPYYDHCIATAHGAVERLGLTQNEWSVAFQSRVGREPWLGPYTDQLLKEYAQGKHRDVCVVCPAFATDCLETLEEIAIRNREDFMAAGGTSYDYIRCLNANDDHVAMFADVITRTR